MHHGKASLCSWRRCMPMKSSENWSLVRVSGCHAALGDERCVVTRTRLWLSCSPWRRTLSSCLSSPTHQFLSSASCGSASYRHCIPHHLTGTTRRTRPSLTHRFHVKPACLATHEVLASMLQMRMSLSVLSQYIGKHSTQRLTCSKKHAVKSLSTRSRVEARGRKYVESRSTYR